MSVHNIDDARKVTTHRLLEMKQRGEKISMLTAYDYTMASIVDEAGIDVILVGDSVSNVVAGNVTTLPISLDQMIYHGKSVVKAVKRALVVVDMPFGSYQISDVEAVKNAIQMMKITHADALKLEGGVEIIDAIKKILAAGIPIMGHLGLMPQSINKYGTYNVRLLRLLLSLNHNIVLKNEEKILLSFLTYHEVQVLARRYICQLQYL